jgi:hypothetical protein
LESLIGGFSQIGARLQGFSELPSFFTEFSWRGVCYHAQSLLKEGSSSMNRYLATGIFVGGIFSALITWIAASDAFAEGGLALLASAVFGLAAGLCIGALIAANFAMLAWEQSEHTEKVAERKEAHAAA